MKLRIKLLLVGLPLVLVFLSFGAPNASPQTNSWISPTRGYWDDYTKWSLGAAPSTNGQTLILINNDVTKTVTLDSYTAENFPGTMIVSDLVVSAPGFATNTLELVDAGVGTPLQILEMLSVTNGGALYMANSAIVMQGYTNSAQNAMVVDGSAVLDVGSVLNASLSLYSGLDPSASGSITLTGGQLLLTNGPPGIFASPPSSIGINGVSQLTVSSGQFQSMSGTMFVGSGQGSSGNLAINGGSVLLAPFCPLVVGMETGAVGHVSVTSGSLVVTNAFSTLVGCDGSGELDLLGGANSFGAMEIAGDPGGLGTLTIGGGVNTISAGLSVGSSVGATGTVWMTGGQLADTNVTASVGAWGYGLVTISNGTWLGKTINLGVHAIPPQSNQGAIPAYGEVDVPGGSMTLYSQLNIGNRSSGGIGVVNITGGSVYVTNAAHNAVLNLSSGQLNLSGGLLQVDTLILTNGWGGMFTHGGGTLIVGTLIDGIPDPWKVRYGFPLLDPTVAGADPDGDGMSNLQEYQAGTDPTNSASFFHIISVVPSGSDMVITWAAVTNKAYGLQALSSSMPGAFANLGTGSFVYTNESRIYTNNPPGSYATPLFGTMVSVPLTPFITQTNYVDKGGATNGARFYRVLLATP
ncbi:MAG TPA: thrombospondin type 3 repeat-containing protein [Verrucomicrobiae bacterium]|nr:thrombospondin type 3 repeat-containing protein [Verrucomicrobiae bacterium]